MGKHILQWGPRGLEHIAAVFVEMVHPMVNGNDND